MAEYRSRRLKLKYRDPRRQPATPGSVRAAAAAKPPPAPVELEWCSDLHDKTMPEQTPSRFAVLSFIDERTFMATFLLIHGFFIVMALVDQNMAHWLADNMTWIMLWLTCVVSVWGTAYGTKPPPEVVFYRIDLASEQILLHVRGRARGFGIMRLHFLEITSIYAFKNSNESTTCGINIAYLDDGLKVRKLQAVDLIPEVLAEAHMDALRPALGVKVKESVTNDY